MPTRSIILRVLLSLCLVLNGAGTAVAAVQMEAASIATGAMASDAMASTAGADVACHDQGMVSDASQHGVMEHDGSSTPSDCCKYGACQCACAQYAQVTIALFAPEGSIGVTCIALHALADGRPAPVPDALLRPPIA